MKTGRCYLNDGEQDALERLSRDYGQSESGILRIALRLFAGLPVPSRIMEQHREHLNEGAHDETSLSAAG